MERGFQWRAGFNQEDGGQPESLANVIIDDLVPQRQEPRRVSNVVEERSANLQPREHLKKSPNMLDELHEVCFTVKNIQQCQESIYIKCLTVKHRMPHLITGAAISSCITEGRSTIAPEPVKARRELGSIKWFNGKRAHDFITLHDSGENMFVYR